MHKTARVAAIKTIKESAIRFNNKWNSENKTYEASVVLADFSTLLCLETDRVWAALVLPWISDIAVTVFSGVTTGGVGPALSLPSCPKPDYIH